MISVVFPVHARTRRRLDDSGLAAGLSDCATLRLTEPLGYLDFLALMAQARLVLTDSGGIQEETTVLGVPCVTVRKSTERPVTVTEGTNRLADPDDVDDIMQVAGRALGAAASPSRPELWDGHAGERIVRALASWWDPRA
jgi:UDP-N-acetylglucosamine 2-epimerase (non-hydrolysing)